jgi:vacuolar-type H+-ATPase subunit H
MLAMYAIFRKHQTLDTKHQDANEIEKKKERILNDAHKKAQKIVATAKSKAIQAMATSTFDLESKLEKVANSTSSKIESKLLAQAENALESYKKQKIQEIDAKAESILTQTIKDSIEQILNKSINISDHRELIFAALEKSKKDHVL